MRSDGSWSSTRPLGATSPARTSLLHGPSVAVRVAEEDEPAPRVFPDFADLYAPLNELGTRRVDLGHDELQALHRSRGFVEIPFPYAIEQADPGGVSCTNRSSSLTRWSWSALKPAFSV